MTVLTHPFTPHWQAELELGYTASATRRARCCAAIADHYGCRSICIPKGRKSASTSSSTPGIIAGGDRLDISVTLGPGAWAQLTSPGAAKWYRAASPAFQDLQLRVEAGATLEWLPQETIVYSAAQAELNTRIELHGDARLFYWDIVALGRPAAGERFDAGHFQARLDIRRDDRLIWHERQRIAGADALLDSPIGLDGRSVFATLIASGEARRGPAGTLPWIAQPRAR